MNAAPEYWWKISLRLKLRQCSGEHFQEFFSQVMQRHHGDNFVRVRPFGQKGDKGCDGYLHTTGQLYQCYGALNGDKSKVDYLISKMATDFATAKAKLGAIMNGWYMVHNMVDGLPVDALETLERLKKANPTINFGYVGLESFEQLIGSIPAQHIDELLGPSATNKDAQDFQTAELRLLVNSVIQANLDATAFETRPIAPVSPQKLDANVLPRYWKQLISGGWQNAHLVSAYFDQHHDPLTGEAIASLFNGRYQYLKAQALPPATIMDALYEFVTGIGAASAARQVAAQALLAYLFESCDIFENAPTGLSA